MLMPVPTPRDSGLIGLGRGPSGDRFLKLPWGLSWAARFEKPPHQSHETTEGRKESFFFLGNKAAEVLSPTMFLGVARTVVLNLAGTLEPLGAVFKKFQFLDSALWDFNSVVVGGGGRRWHHSCLFVFFFF